MTHIVTSAGLEQFVRQVLPQIKKSRIVALSGDLGAGKTTFVSQLCRQLGVAETVQSPTFTYLNVYHAADGTPIYHFDLHRLGSVAEFFAAGFDEYVGDPQALVLVEWPEIITAYLPANALWMRFEHADDPDVRRVQVGDRP